MFKLLKIENARENVPSPVFLDVTANEAVASHLFRSGIPCVYRIHEQPPADHFADFLSYLESLGFDKVCPIPERATSWWIWTA